MPDLQMGNLNFTSMLMLINVCMRSALELFVELKRQWAVYGSNIEACMLVIY